MVDYGIGKYKTLNSFVDHKMALLENSDKSMATLFELMFSEKENIMYEKSEGYRIVKTTYGQAYQDISKLTGDLAEKLKDIPKGSIVGLYMNNSLKWLELFWAILKSGYDCLLMNNRLDKDILEKTLIQINCQAVISDGVLFSNKTILASEIGMADNSKQLNCEFGEHIILMSSGTSDSIKLCYYGSEQLAYQISDSRNIIKNCKLMKKHYNGKLKQLAFLPYYHIFGLFAVYFWFCFFSRTLVELSDMRPNTIINTINRHKVTHIFAVPLFWNKVYQQAIATIKAKGQQTYEKFNKGLKIYQNLSFAPFLQSIFSKLAFKEVRENMFGESISFMISGGGAINQEILTFFNSIGYHLANGYGMSEVGITSVELSNKKYLLDGSVGQPLKSLEYKIDQDNQLLIFGKTISQFIICDNEKHEMNGWFSTNDLAKEIDGHYYILGRQDDIVIGDNGENLNPNLIENNFINKNIDNVALISAPINQKNLAVLIVSITKKISEKQFNKIDNQIKKTISEYNYPIGKVEYVSDELIGSNDFKVNRRIIKEKYLQNALHPFEIKKTEESIDNETIRILKEMFGQALGKDGSQIATKSDFFTDEGGSSLDYFSLASSIEEYFAVSIISQDNKTYTSVYAIYELLKEQNKDVD